jgi:lysophospholipase L1-like esterase
MKKIVCSVLLLFWGSGCGSAPKGVILFCAGDSITEYGYVSYLRKTLKKEGFRAKVLNYGRSGNTTGEYLRFLSEEKNGLKSVRPDFVLIQLGTNDVRLDADRTSSADFRRNLEEIILFFKDFRTRSGLRPRIFLATIPPVPAGVVFPFGPESSARVTADINPAIMHIAREKRLDLVDNFSLFAASPGLLRDVHPSAEGYRAIALNWYKAVKPHLSPVR